ncbi:MAG: ABC transporter ATP-binding protein [Nitrospirae bacterium]|nr:ABC transporter ATP-binding protein [Nitrospirota bacterium]
MSNNDEPLIEVVNLTKRFDNLTAVDNISFTLNNGEIFGFLGPNGAGKTTTIRMLIGLSRPDSGTIKVAGKDCTGNPKAAQHLIGVVPDESNLYPELTGFDNLCFCGALYGMSKTERIERANKLLKTFGLTEAANRKFGGYSKGMKRKLTIAAGIIHRPQILFLDEPTTGIDVASARQVRQLISSLNNSGTTIFLTTHYIEDAERLCHRISFIVKGKIAKTDSVKNLLQPLLGRYVMLVSASGNIMDISRQLSSSFSDYTFNITSPEHMRVEANHQINLVHIVKFLQEHGIDVTEAKKSIPSMEDVFVSITGIEANILKKEADKKRKSE